MWSLTLGFVFITMVAFAYQEPIESLQHVLVYPMEPGTKKTKREVSAVRTRVDFNKFVEEKLIQHTQALEHLVKLAQQNEETIKQLVAILSRDFEKPKLPEKLESRRSFGSRPLIVPQVQNEDQPSPWCSVAILCRRSIDPVCGYDDNFGYGKFDDICHMLQVNCYWKYNFALVPSCKPVL
ncbi:uncharacterized protein LOC120633805 isoform X2 [Pararge aegeria]|uniref:uncharacterized protein LOC120633805 isoform X2 n=1 Tax=Pararge aegeria TaxID=116150 RepID=UPI0019CF776A|nr:uncharacterized protein LOC120633805 isoform X2 [Pararge aegeria]